MYSYASADPVLFTSVPALLQNIYKTKGCQALWSWLRSSSAHHTVPSPTTAQLQVGVDRGKNHTEIISPFNKGRCNIPFSNKCLLASLIYIVLKSWYPSVGEIFLVYFSGSLFEWRPEVIIEINFSVDRKCTFFNHVIMKISQTSLIFAVIRQVSLQVFLAVSESHVCNISPASL